MGSSWVLWNQTNKSTVNRAAQIRGKTESRIWSSENRDIIKGTWQNVKSWDYNSFADNSALLAAPALPIRLLPSRKDSLLYTFDSPAIREWMEIATVEIDWHLMKPSWISHVYCFCLSLKLKEGFPLKSQPQNRTVYSHSLLLKNFQEVFSWIYKCLHFHLWIRSFFLLNAK